MSKRNAILLLKDILESARLIEEYTDGLNFEAFFKDTKTRDAAVRIFEIIGEAANNLPKDLIENYPEVDWAGIVGFRNVLIHNYFGVDYAMLWNIRQVFLPELKK
ncbi:MAG: DUF86 domain-containing protein [Saprospiraceae bacterium]|nr:DUF86 domain-containing protein [Saprospiraceae bacterium]